MSTDLFIICFMRIFSLTAWLRIFNRHENQNFPGQWSQEVQMRSLMYSMMMMGLAASFAGCAAGSDDPAESAVSSEVTVNAWNFVRSCTPLALRTCDNPGSCDTGVRLALHSQVFVIGFDSGTKMAHLSQPSGWARADGVDGEVYLSINDGPCN